MFQVASLMQLDICITEKEHIVPISMFGNKMTTVEHYSLIVRIMVIKFLDWWFPKLMMKQTCFFTQISIMH